MRLSVLASIATAGLLFASVAEAQSPNAACTAKCIRAYNACIKSCGAGVSGGKCETRCSEAQDSCMSKCKSTGDAYQKCIKAAKTPAERQACIDQYHSDWGTGAPKKAK